MARITIALEIEYDEDITNQECVFEEVRSNIHHISVRMNPDYATIESVKTLPHPEDSSLIDFLEAQNAKALYTGKCKFRWSATGRGWRLHETNAKGAHNSVRQAIASGIKEAQS
jgi:hypothetical protein